MQTLTLDLRDGEISLHCTGCARDFAIDRGKPFILQLQLITYDHHCPPLSLGSEQVPFLAQLQASSSSSPNTG